MITIRNLIKDYKVSKTTYRALDDISLDFPAVQFVSVLGPSGCGKSTFLNLIGGLDSITSGSIEVDGISLSEMNSHELDSYRNNSIGFIFQNYYLIPQLSVLDNIKIALAVRDYDPKDVDEKARKALERVGLSDIAKKKPSQLSGGQAQRVAIARAIVTDPKIILADEPTGALDSENSRIVMEILKEISKDRLVIMVTHNEDLAEEYSNRIIRMSDGKIIKDDVLSETEGKEQVSKEMRKSRLSLKMSAKLSFKNVLSRKVKTILTAVANSFGMVGIAFLLAINHGFDIYSNSVSRATASSMPVVISTYDKTTTKEKYDEKNASEKYTDKQEIYPSVSLDSQYSYKYNQISPKYLSYVDSLVDEGLVREYVLNYGYSYSLNLTTRYPGSIDGTYDAGIETCNTSVTNYNYYANSMSLPYNIFHVLYGDMEDYDVITGTMPQEKNEICLVVDEYNSVSFSILRELGFYNPNDKEADVEDTALETKVKPIKFEDVIGKEYKVYSNDEYYTFDHSLNMYDKFDDGLRQPSYYTAPELTDAFYDSSDMGTTLKITGILRAKDTTSLTILSPSLCYLPSLLDDYLDSNENSKIASTFENNVVFIDPDDTGTAPDDFANAILNVVNDYIASEDTTLPTSELTDIFDEYFDFQVPVYNGSYHQHSYGFDYMFYLAKRLGVELVPDWMKTMNLSDKDTIQELADDLEYDIFHDRVKAYEDVIGIVAYAEGYSVLQSVIIFPVDIQTRTTVIARLDSYNEIGTGSNHANSASEQVSYVKSDASAMLTDVADVISLCSIILLVFAVISLVVSCSMTALLTSNSVLERKKEIGLLRSLGARKSDVWILFESESLLIGAFAGLIGSFITWLFSMPLNSLINSMYDYYKVGSISNFTWYHLLIVLAISMTVAFVSALIPAIKASVQNPVDSLRNE